MKKDIAGAITILEDLTAADPVHERNAAKRVLAEVTRAWPGDTPRLWWKWFAEASSSLGIRVKAMDCSIEEAASLADAKARFVCYKPGETEMSGEWIAVHSSARSKHALTFASESGGRRTKTLSNRKLKRLLKDLANDEGRVRCVVIQATKEVPNSAASSKVPMSPFKRLLEIAKPEKADIWNVAIYAFVVALLMLATPMAVEALVNTVAFGRFLQPIVVLAIILLVFLGFQGAMRGLHVYVVEIIQRRLFARVAADLAFRIPRFEAEATDKKYVPELINRFFDIVSVQKVSAQLLVDGIGLVLTTFIGMAVLGFYHPWLLGFDLFLLAAIAVIVFLLGRGATASAIKESKYKYYMASWLEDIGKSPSAFHGDGGAAFALERADRLVHEYLIARKNHFAIIMRQLLFALGLQAIASTILLGIGGWLVVTGGLTLGQLVAAELIVTVVVGSFAKIPKHMESLYDMLASVDKLGVLFDLPIEREDGMLGVEPGDATQLRLHAVSYGYPGQPKVINNLYADIRPGDRVAILGKSGSGKSTLVDLFYGFRAPTSGHLSLDEFDPKDLRPDILRHRVSLARDEVFNASVDENVHMHRDDIRSTDVRAVLESIGLLRAALSLPKGLETELSSDGKPFSENQRKLLSLARACVGRPGLLLVDGLLDSLGDSELEHVLNYLTSPEQPWTLVVATSREDIASHLDQTIFLGDSSAVV
jgi:putative ABC transport system ATP-binding protein